MSTSVLFSAPDQWWEIYRPQLARALAEEDLEIGVTNQTDAPETVEYIIYHPDGPVTDFSIYPNLKAVLSLWAGVERALANPTLTGTLCRMVDPSLTQGMVEYVTGHVLRYHLGIDAHLGGQDGVWRNEITPPLSRHRRVGILGLGALGSAVVEALAGLGFDVEGWSRRPRDPGSLVTHSGEDGLATLLARSEILVTLLPGTPDTENLLNRRTLALLPEGARLINPGRGGIVNDQALLEALDEGRVDHATLDVFRVEPLPPDHPYWSHPKVTVTPHVASETRAETAAETIALNIRRGEDGEPFLYTVDRTQGY